MKFLNTEIISNPLNWAIVMTMALFGVALLAITLPDNS